MYSFNDPLLSYGVLNLILKNYIPSGIDPMKDPFVSPSITSNEVFIIL